MTAHKATPEQWEATEEYAHAAIGCYSDSCILELRDRIAALEAAANSSAALTGSPAPPGVLVEMTMLAAGLSHTEARAAVKAVAEWFDAIGYGATASILRQELQRHG
jgi:hypothetical protein